MESQGAGAGTSSRILGTAVQDSRKRDEVLIDKHKLVGPTYLGAPFINGAVMNMPKSSAPSASTPYYARSTGLSAYSLIRGLLSCSVHNQ